MNRYASYIIAFIAILIFAVGCSTTQNQSQNGFVSELASDNDGNSVKVNDTNLELADYLRRLPGVRVMGQGEVLVRGVSSIEGDNRPLFVVDEVHVGRDFYSVRDIVDVENINYVKVLKGAEATMYGMQGSNGVIKIVTR